MKKRLNKSTVIALLFWVLAGISSSQIVTLKITGIVTGGHQWGGFTFDGSVAVGSAITGSITWDTDIIPSNDKYPASETLSVGNYSFSSNPSVQNAAVIFKNIGDHGYMTLCSSLIFDGTIYDSGTPKHYNDVVWNKNYSDFRYYLWINPFGSSMLEDIYNILNSSNRKEFSLTMAESDTNYATQGNLSINGNITSLQLVPEPATIILFGAAVPFMLRRRRLHV